VRGDDVVEIRYRGRTFFVGAARLGDFEGDPEAYFRQLQARAGLFDEEALQGRAATGGWLILGLYVLAGLLFAAWCGYLAVGKALAPVPWFFAGLVGNVAALVVLWIAPRREPAALAGAIPSGLGKVAVTPQPVPCPGCWSSNHPAATACSLCGAELTPTVEPETARLRGPGGRGSC
jgi:hypothetical protein